MRLFRFLPGVLAALLTLSATAQTAPTALSDAQIEAAKSAAAAVSGTLSTQALQVDADGRPVIDANGRAQTQTGTANTMRDSLRTFQGYTGIESTEQVSSPGNAGRAGLVKLNVNATVDFKCSTRAYDASAGALGLRVASCDPTNGAYVQICDKPSKGGTCSQDTDYQSAVLVAPGVFSTISGMQVGLGCNSTATCRITVKGTYTVGGSDATLKQQAQASGNAADDSTIVGSLRQAVTQGDYAGKMTEIGAPLKACADANENSMNTGSASTCDGKQTVTVTNSTSKPPSTGPRVCLKEATSDQSFIRSCTRTFPLTERISAYKYTQTLTCIITDSLDPLTNKTSTTDSCAPPSQESVGTNGVVKNPRAGFTSVGGTARTCSRMEDKPVPAGETPPETPEQICVEWTQSEYMVNTSVSTVLSQSASPSAVTGKCDTNPLSETRVSTCQNNNWFGRTLAATDCKVQTVDDATGAGTGVALDMTYQDKAGCGFCMTPQVGETCYGAPSETDPADSCAGAQIDGCSLKTATPRSYTGDGGLVSSQEEVYECKTSNKTCVQWSQGSEDNTLSTGMTLGLENVKSNPNTADGSLNNAMVAAAMLDSTSQGVEGPQAPNVPLIFPGTEMRCKRATGGIGQLFGRNCCSTDIERPIGRQLTRAGCSLDDARLAAARRSHYAHYIGDYCSRSMRFPRRCLERTETYCTFAGILPRLIQEQGRGQLAQIAATGVGADVQRSPMKFDYYDAQNGSWSPETLVNGVRVRAWQWPSYCANPELAGQKLLNDPDAKDCPGVVTSWIAACDNSAGCGDLPDEPSSGSSTWALHVLDPLQNTTSAVSKYSVVTGACSPATNKCDYTAAGWPVGIGGKQVVSRDLTWPLYSNEQPSTNNVSAAQYQMNNIADLMFRGYSVPGTSGGLPATVRLDFSRNGGQTWTTHQLPTNLRTGEFTIPGSDVTVTGYCDTTTNLCGYRITGTTVVVGKPWGSAQNPNCSGFTAGQLSAMDFGKMDLSEWLSTVLSKTSGNTNNTALVGQATKEFQAYNSLYSSGGTVTAKASAPQAANFARAVPAEGFGPFNVKLVVSGIWPEVTGDPAVDRDRVTRVDVNWGDCGVTQSLSAVPATQGTGFSGVHQFNGPDAYWSCLSLPKNTNVTHNVKLTVYTTLSGVQNRVVKVENAYATFPGGNKNNDYVGSKATATPLDGTSTPPRP